MKALNQKEAIEELWRRGILEWKWRPVQKRIDQALSTAKGRKRVLNCSRRIGKSFYLFSKAVSYALQHPEWPVRYIAPTQTALTKIIEPIARQVLKDCPKWMKPERKKTEKVYVFKNGAEIHLAGANNGHADDSRGQAAGLAIVDEAGFVDDLTYLVDDVLMPQLINTGGILVLSSTPPRTPAHDFMTYVEEAKLRGAYAEFDIYQSGYPQETINEFCEEAGGPESTTWLREYCCKPVVDADSAVIPEWNDKWTEERKKDNLDPYHDRYEGMDLGVVDMTVDLFATYEFPKATIFFEDEVWMRGPQMTTDKLSSAIKEKERELWGTIAPRLRVADNNNPLLLNDLDAMHRLPFIPVTKDELVAMVNEFRLWVKQGRVRVSPKCKQLLGCLRAGVWDDKKLRRQFARSRDFGHFDALAAAIYLVRYVDQQRNPIPPLLGVSEATHFIPPGVQSQSAQTENALKSMIGLK